MSTTLLPFGLAVCAAIIAIYSPLVLPKQSNQKPAAKTAPARLDTPKRRDQTARSLGELPKTKTMKEVKLPTFVDSDSSDSSKLFIKR